LQHHDLGALDRREVLALAGLELRHRVLALLDHLVDDREHVGVRHLLALVDLTLLDGREQQADRRQPRGILRAHGVLHVVLDAGLEGHGRQMGSEGSGCQPGSHPDP